MRIVYFDGECNVCNQFVNFLIRHDRKRIYRYASLQGAKAAERLPLHFRQVPLTTMVLEKDGAFLIESTAALETVAGLGGVYVLIRIFLLIPSKIRDLAYRWLARHRYRWFGKREQCRLPTAEERELFL